MKTYIQIGSNVGKDYFQQIIEKLNEASLVILVEPNNELIEQLKNNYKHLEPKHTIHICNKAISFKNETLDLYVYNTDTQHASLVKRKTHMVPFTTLQVEAITFDQLCILYNIQDVQLLYIDTEGADYEIINSIDFSKIKINSLFFEMWGYNNDDLNNKFKTGEEYFHQFVKQKVEKYFSLKEIVENNYSYISKNII